jgi:hypothetical protein
MPPAPWVWWGIFFAIIALGVSIMALSIWNKPKVILSFEIQKEKGNNLLILCGLITNELITNRFKQFMGFYRREVEIGAMYSIEALDKADKVVEDVICDIYTTFDSPKATVILRSISPAIIKIVEVGGVAARTIAPHQPKNINLPQGKYRAVAIVTTPEKDIKSDCEFSLSMEGGKVLIKLENTAHAKTKNNQA